MDPRADELHDILDCSAPTLQALAARIEASDTEMRLVYRETELDELWRWAEVALAQVQPDGDSAQRRTHWTELRAEIMRIHDLVGIETDRASAARGLRALAWRLADAG
jgi:hypothetical protein